MMERMLLASPGNRLRQGDVFRNVDFPLYSSIDGTEANLSVIRFPRAVVLSQDCDVQQDQGVQHGTGSGGTRLISVLMAPLYEMNDAVGGNHLRDLNWNAPPLPPKPKKDKGGSGADLRSNMNPRYHCLPLSHVLGCEPDLIADFKHYFSVGSEYLMAVRDRALVASLDELYREDLSQRFAAYLARIGLPTPIHV